MKYTKEQQKSAYKNLSEDVQYFIMSNDVTELTENYLESLGIDEDKADSADSEILYAMYNLQTFDSAIENISSITGKSIPELQTLKEKLWVNIFSKIEEINSKSKKIDPTFAKKRLAEIVNKYGLTTNQATVLENEVMSVIDRNLGEKITSQDLTNLLNISNLLAEQIVYELEARVFERGVKIPEKPKVSVEPASKPELVSFGNTTLNIPKEMLKPAFQNEALDSQKTSSGTSIGVPRYATEDIYKQTQPASNPIVNNKLNAVTPSIRPIETKYQKDPYREPTE